MKQILLLILGFFLFFSCEEKKEQSGVASDGKLYILFEEKKPLTMEDVRISGKCVAENIRIDAELKRPSAYHLCLGAMEQNERLNMKFSSSPLGVVLEAVCLVEKAKPTHNWNASSIEDYTKCENGNLCCAGWNNYFWAFYVLDESGNPIFSPVGLSSYEIKNNATVILMYSQYDPNFNP